MLKLNCFDRSVTIIQSCIIGVQPRSEHEPQILQSTFFETTK